MIEPKHSCTFCGAEFTQDQIDSGGAPLPTGNRNAKQIVRIAGIVHQFDARHRKQDRQNFAGARVVPRPAEAQTTPAPVETPASPPEPVAEPVTTPPADIPTDISAGIQTTAGTDIDVMVRRLRTGWLHEN